MAPLGFSLLLLMAVTLLISPSHSLSCTSQKFANNHLYQCCTDLPQLNSSLHYTYDPANSSLSVAFVASLAAPDGWIAWAVNPSGTGMIGSQAIIGFKDSDGSMIVKTYDIKYYGPIVESKLAFEVTQTSAEYSQELMRIFATLVFPANWNYTKVNHVWQVGASVTGGVPDKHAFLPANLISKGTLDLLTGQTTGGTRGDSRLTMKNIHGILNALSWGTLFPMGIIIARYMRFFPSLELAWFNLHVFCQTSAYAVGFAGWGTGLRLGSQSKGVEYTGHRNMGIALFSLATVQIFALFLRLKKDHKHRFYWNIYHHGVGYTITILGVLNVFKGLDILDPDKKWKSTYIGIISALGGIALFLEVITWILVLWRKCGNSTKPV